MAIAYAEFAQQHLTAAAGLQVAAGETANDASAEHTVEAAEQAIEHAVENVEHAVENVEHGVAEGVHNIETSVGHGHGAEGGAGMPQLDFDTFPSQIFWLVVALVALYYILSRIALPRIGSVLEARSDTIADDLDRAAEYKRRAEEADHAYQAALAEARSKAQDIAAKTKAEIQKGVDKAIADADAEISARTAESEKRLAEIRESALGNVEIVAADTAAALIKAIAPGAANAKAVKTAVAAKLQR
jgi:F-type H+-transporting ATPase subunit b